MLEYHEIANIFPLIEGPHFDDFKADIRANGLQEKIVLLDGRILDGRNRYRALLAEDMVSPIATANSLLRVDDRFVDFEAEHPGKDPLDWVLSLNLQRRHLDESQRAAVGASMETLTHGGRRVPAGQDAGLQLDRKHIAEVVKVSPRLVASAAKVRKHGAPELFEAVQSGKVKASVAESLLTLSKDKQAQVLNLVDTRKLATMAKQAKREDREQQLASRQRALPTRLYGVILADPPWRFEPYSRETGLDRAADNHYPTQETGEIKMLPVGTLAASDCVLFLWATVPMLEDALAVMRYWGFKYVSNFNWAKDRIGHGYWSRNKHEHLLIGVKGNPPAPAPGTQFESNIEAAVGEHSAKPDRFYEIIESYFPNLPKIELNARRARDGWDAWGLEAPEETGEASSHEPRAAAGEDGAATLSPAAFYSGLVAGDAHKGNHTAATAEPIVRAAYACDPIIPTKQLAADLGHPMGTVLTWAYRLDLTKGQRRDANKFGQGRGQ
ncbi:Adenine-specific DNA methyltransferase [Devosia sp. DBB001]|nr:Adenine-specific DNA methyltransferase [Devosia sp. DBB001]